MTEDINKIEELSEKLDRLLSMHNSVSNEIDNLRVEIIRLKVEQKQKSSSENYTPSDDAGQPQETDFENESSNYDESEIEFTSSKEDEFEESSERAENPNVTIPKGEQNTDYFQTRKKRAIYRKTQISTKKKFDIEKLIGENLINKIGILVIIIGAVIGTKYYIENNLVSPLERIISGYIMGIILLGLGMWLKKKYLNFSAVLISGAMAIFYLITFFAFNFYELIGQEVAFGLMVIFTIFTVLAALNYDKQIIAHLGLVGAISIPFLLSNDSGNVLFLFSYLSLINIGIAYISLRKNWKPLFYSAFAITWLVYFTWIVFDYKESEHFTLTLCFLTIFFILFYVIFIAYKFLNLKKYNVADVIVLLLNALIFFAIGYNLLYDHKIGRQVLGVFAVGNAFIHFIAAALINRRKLADRNLFYLIVGLVLVCLTLAIPIQLDGHWVTIMWSAEAVALFFIGRRRQVVFYEYISFALMAIAGLSLVQDWEAGYYSISIVNTYSQGIEDSNLTLFFNTLFLSSLSASICLGIIFWIHNQAKWKFASKLHENLIKTLDYAIPVALILVIYFALRLEIMHYFSQLYTGAIKESNLENNSFSSKIYNVDIKHRCNVWLLDYTMLFFGFISILMYKKTKSVKAIWAIVAINSLVVVGFLLQGLHELSELRVNYLDQHQAEYFSIDNSFIWIRYLSIAILAFLIGCTYFLLRKNNKNYKIYAIAETLFYMIILWVSTSELIQWLDFTERSEIYGLALSIYWGIFSVIIIALGIWKKKKHLRILGIAIFAITLVKLFFYDLSHLTTIAKTIVMISLGTLLLLTSFLYHKYTIEDEGEF